MTACHEKRPVIACIAMIRDEADVLPAFLGHVAELFDFALFVDHLSVDGSAALLDRAAADWPRIKVWRLTAPGYWQSAVMTALAREAFRRGAHWVVPLDADEFLGVADRPALEAQLFAAHSHVAFFRWRHAVTDDAVLEGHAPLVWPLQKWLANASLGKPGQGKVALHRQTAEAFPQFLFSPGNHRLIPCPFAKPQTGPDSGTIWHLPVRTRQQFLTKLRRDLVSHAGRDGRAIAGMGAARPVKQALLEKLLSAPADTDALRKIALGYWEVGLDCLSPAITLPSPIEMPPDFAMQPTIAKTVPPNPQPVCGQDESPFNLDNVSMVVARLSGAAVVVEPAGRMAQLAAVIEIWLEKHFTPGFRVARFLAGRWAAFRLAMSRHDPLGQRK